MKLESEYETVRAERDVALAEVERLNEEAASLASQLAAQVAANATLRRTVAERDAAGIVLEWDIDALKRENAELRMEAAVRLRPVEAIPCGRFDDHEAHLWSDAGPDYQCPGYQD